MNKAELLAVTKTTHFGIIRTESIRAALPSKYKWKTLIHKQVNKYWIDNISQSAKLHKTRRFMKFDRFNPGSVLCVLR
ncbi:hypothetical protein MAR_025016, partial [Mya arenaria]